MNYLVVFAILFGFVRMFYYLVMAIVISVNVVEMVILVVERRVDWRCFNVGNVPWSHSS